MWLGTGGNSKKVSGRLLYIITTENTSDYHWIVDIVRKYRVPEASRVQPVLEVLTQILIKNMLQPNTGNVCWWRLTHISSFVDSNSIFWQRDGYHCHSYDAADDTHAQQASWSGTRNERNSGSGSLARTPETWDIFDTLQIYTFNVNIFLIHLYLFKYISSCIIIYITII